MSNADISGRITAHINDVSGWRGKTLARLRKAILDAAPGLTEEWKWNTPVWSLNGNVVAAGAFQDQVKMLLSSTDVCWWDDEAGSPERILQSSEGGTRTRDPRLMKPVL